ncbi:S9 family peptidase [Brevundimonas sp. 2R-24]|uniref:S9 family peptidase n=1 Tax=Peiella sedimenti TaxID=3061083 RepID=A0ABT8SM75_9CAUL|nr:S9 family peptidase [Caulobacteraceae bacterium XZ-24]
MWKNAVRAVVVAVLAFGAAPPALARTPVPIDTLTDVPVLTSATLSPSGRYVAYLRRQGAAHFLAVKDLQTGQERGLISARATQVFGGTSIRWIGWKDGDRLLASVQMLELTRDGPTVQDNVTGYRASVATFAMNPDGSERVELRGTQSRSRFPGEVIDFLPNDPDHVLVVVRDAADNADVVRLNIRTGQGTPVLDGDRSVLGYVTDRHGQVIARYVRGALSSRERYLEARLPEGGWQRVADVSFDSMSGGAEMEIIGPAPESGQVYVVVPPEHANSGLDVQAVHIYDFRTRTLGAPVWRHERYDAASAVINPRTGELEAGCYVADVFRCEYLDPARQALRAAVEGVFEGRSSVRVQDRSADGQAWLLHVSGSDDPGGYYLFDTQARSMTDLGPIYADLVDVGLRPAERVDYTAADGTQLHGYLTLPAPRADGSAPPLVVLPHGGPAVRDSMDYSPWVQFLATRGYAVFQPNFRGSKGFGAAFEHAGDRQWGRLMQSDVEDGVQSLINAGRVDGGRMCMMGASYGGYVALWAGASTGDRYRCIISIAGVSDQRAIMRWERSTAGAESRRYRYWLRNQGHPETDAEYLDETSPIRRVADFQAPVLMFHGDQDPIVPFEQSRDMDAALRGARKNVRLIKFENEGHSGWYTANERTMLREVEAFLNQHLPAN